MSYYDEYTRCPQCTGVATATFDNHRHSREIYCAHCGYSEYRGPRYDERGLPDLGSRTFETQPGLGTLSFLRQETKGITTIRQLKTDQDIEAARQFVEEQGNSFTWYRLMGWDARQSKVVILDEFLAEGATVPLEFRGLSIQELEEGIPE